MLSFCILFISEVFFSIPRLLSAYKMLLAISKANTATRFIQVIKDLRSFVANSKIGLIPYFPKPIRLRHFVPALRFCGRREVESGTNRPGYCFSPFPLSPSTSRQAHRAAGICGPHTRAMHPKGFEFPRVSGKPIRRGAASENGRGQV